MRLKLCYIKISKVILSALLLSVTIHTYQHVIPLTLEAKIKTNQLSQIEKKNYIDNKLSVIQNKSKGSSMYLSLSTT